MPVDLAAIEGEEDGARQRAQGVLANIQALNDHVKALQAGFEAGPVQVISARTDVLEKLKGAKGEARALAQKATEAALAVERAAHKAELVRQSQSSGDALARYDQAHDLSGQLHQEANAMRDLVEQIYDGLAAQDRTELLESRERATHLAKNRLEAQCRGTERPPNVSDLVPRHIFAHKDNHVFWSQAEEDKLVIVRSKPNRRVLAASQAQTPAAGMPPIGVAMAGEAQMPIGWAIPGDASNHWMWAQLTIINTDKSLLLPIRRCEILELTEALGKMLGRSHEDFKLFVRQGAHIKRLLPTDVVPSKLFVKGISSWVRERQKYKHPFTVIGAGHLGLRQALECIKQKVDDFVLFERLDRVGGEAWQRVANRGSRLQTELGTYHVPFGSSWPVPSGMATWPTREELLGHFEKVVSEFGILPHVQLKTNVTGMKIEKMSRLQMLEEGKGDTDPNSQHYKLTLQQQAEFEGQWSAFQAAKAKEEKEAKEKKKKAGSKGGADEAPEEGAEEGGASAGPEKTTFQASAVMMFPGALSVPREEIFKGEEVFGGPVAYGMGDKFDYEEAKDKLVAICGMGSLAVENVRSCLESGAKSCSIICRRKNLTLPRAVSWFVNQSAVPPTTMEILTALLPMYNAANDDPWGYYAVSPDATMIQQRTRFPVSDFFFLATYYGRVEVVLGEVKRLLHQMVVLDSDKKLGAHCIVKALGFKGSFEVDSLMHSSKMFGFWPDADYRRWIYCESVGVDFMSIASTSLSPLAMRIVEFPLHFLAFPKPDFKEIVDGGSMHWNSADHDNDQPAHVLSARDAYYVISLALNFAPALQEMDYDGVKRKRQQQCHPVEEFIKEAAADWSSYCSLLGGGAGGKEAPEYPYSVDYMKDLVAKSDKEGKKRVAGAASTVESIDGGPTRAWNPHLKMYC